VVSYVIIFPRSASAGFVLENNNNNNNMLKFVKILKYMVSILLSMIPLNMGRVLFNSVD
jgi:hypothetical protein